MADNIIVDQRRAAIDLVKIVDFGIARLVTGVRETEDRSISGTPEYMAPEVIGGAPPSFASDIYAVGIILYELLAEQTPFFASATSEILTNHLRAQPRSLAARREGVPKDVDLVIAKALAKSPPDPYPPAAGRGVFYGAARPRRGPPPPFYPTRSLLAAVRQLPPMASEGELREIVLALGLNERDIPGIAQLFGNSTTLLELEPHVRRRE